MPACTTTTVRGLAVVTDSTRRAWSPGKHRFVRSLLSVSCSSVLPTRTMAMSASAAARTARDAVGGQTALTADLDQDEWAKIESGRHFDKVHPGTEYHGLRGVARRQERRRVAAIVPVGLAEHFVVIDDQPDLAAAAYRRIRTRRPPLFGTYLACGSLLLSVPRPPGGSHQARSGARCAWVRPAVAHPYTRCCRSTRRRAQDLP